MTRDGNLSAGKWFPTQYERFKLSMYMITVTQGTQQLVQVPATAAGLKELMALKVRRSTAKIHITYGDLDEEAQVNFIAMVQKTVKHLRFILESPAITHGARTRIWRKYWRNKVDSEHGEGIPHLTFMSGFLERAGLDFVAIDQQGFQFKGNFGSAAAIAATAGRLVNAMKWCAQWTHSIRLVSEADISWETFNKITLKGEQPIVRRRK